MSLLMLTTWECGKQLPSGAADSLWPYLSGHGIIASLAAGWHAAGVMPLVHVCWNRFMESSLSGPPALQPGLL